MAFSALLATGSKVWLDGIAAEEIAKNRARGITGATSNPAIVAKIIQRGEFERRIGECIDASNKTYTRQVDQMPPAEVISEIDRRVDMATLERVLMEKAIRKFADPQKALIALIAEKRAAS